MPLKNDPICQGPIDHIAYKNGPPAQHHKFTYSVSNKPSISSINFVNYESDIVTSWRTRQELLDWSVAVQSLIGARETDRKGYQLVRPVTNNILYKYFR